ncbi:unnamed protein product [Oncorhynchus mykiss]|uniref:Uncharacterized protein n=1 Tax=Oncorhynchus mykiss TaxID=8022 RepID=A0A060Y2L3_ONCMY|nr:unnamed protein product [Oncorhynchus mykiss]
MFTSWLHHEKRVAASKLPNKRLVKLGPSSLSSISHTKSCHFRNGCQYDKASHCTIITMHWFHRCCHCDKCTTYACEKCKVSLHNGCFKIYHGQ